MNSSLLWIWTCGDMDAFTYFIDTVTVQVNFEVSEGTIISSYVIVNIWMVIFINFACWYIHISLFVSYYHSKDLMFQGNCVKCVGFLPEFFLYS